MKLPAMLERTLVEPRIEALCPTVCPFNRTCPRWVQQGVEKLWTDGTLTGANFRTACFAYGNMTEDLKKSTGLAEPPADAQALYEFLLERVAIEEPAPTVPASIADDQTRELQEHFLKLRDRERQRRDAATKAAYDASHPQQELGV